jgi:hypothetical protein
MNLKDYIKISMVEASEKLKSRNNLIFNMMKNLSIKVLLAVFLFSISLFSCKKDENKIAGTFEYNGKTYETSHGYISNPRANSFLIILCSSDLSFNESISNFSGNGDFMNLVLINNDSQTELTNTNYIYSETEPTHIFWGAMFFEGYIASSELYTGRYQIDYPPSEGNVEYTKSGDTYDISYNFYVNGIKVTGTYSGKLENAQINLGFKNSKIYSFEK